MKLSKKTQSIARGWARAVLALFAFHFSLITASAQSWTADNGNGTFTNPLFYDEFSDPDILRVGDDYYLAGTTMHAVPGLVILHSKDLVNWENISYCFDRFDFTEDRFSLKNHEEIYGQGIWAPCIRYANGQFYVFSNVNGKGLQCYTAKDIRGPWTHHNMQGNIYDLGVLFDDDGKVYAIHGYGTVKCTELKPDMSGPVEGTERVIIPEGNGVGEGHHMYKIDGMYYLISTDYSPNGRTLCSRSKSIWGPYETRVITADETYGYHAASLTQVPRGEKYRIGHDGTKFHSLTIITELLQQLSAADSEDSAGHHRLNRRLCRTTVKIGRIVSRKLALKREPRNMCLVVAHAIFYIFETSFSDKSEPPCRVTLALQLVTLAVSDFLTLPLAELQQHLQVNTIVCFLESLFHSP